MLLNRIDKTSVINGLIEKRKHIATQNNTKAQILNNFIELIKTCNIKEYYNIKTNDNLNGLNIGDVGENIVLHYFNLKRENALHEIKTFIIDTPNILIDKSAQVVYILMTFNALNGLYKVNANDIFNKRLSKKLLNDLIKNNKMVKVASLQQLATTPKNN